MRWLLAVDDDHSEFLRRFKSDKLLSGPISQLQGKRVLRVGTVAQSLLRALCGQLIEAWRARAMEKRIIRTVGQPVGDLHAPPDCATLARCSPAELARSGCMLDAAPTLAPSAGRSSSSGSRSTRRTSWPSGWDANAASARGRSASCASRGSGRNEYGLVGDLGLVKLQIALEGRWVEGHETAKLLEPYEEWAGLASVYLMAGFARGLIPLPDGARIRKASATAAPASGSRAPNKEGVCAFSEGMG